MRNNYADNDAQPVCKVVIGHATNATLVEAADPDQFWVVDYIAVDGSGQVKIQYDSDRALPNTDPKVIFDYSFPTGGDNILFPPIYRGVKNEPLYVVAPASAKVSIRYR